MNDKSNILMDKVNVTMHAVSLSDKDLSYAKVQRNTALIGNVVDNILEHNKVIDRETLLYTAGLFRNGMLNLLRTGKAVDLLELGTLYIKPAGSIASTEPGIEDVPKMTVLFTPSELAVDAVKDVSAGADVTAANEPVLNEVFNMKLKKASSAVSKGYSVRIKGKRLKVAGEEGATGIFFASCDSSGKYDDDSSKWISVSASELIDNASTVLVFNVPEEMESGSYRLIVRTAYGSGTRINKTVRTGLFPSVIEVS